MDKRLIEILRTRFQAIVDEMGFTILRTGHTVFIKETGDFGTALVTAAGEVFAAPTRIGMIRTVGMPMRPSIEATAPHIEGDIYISNDPIRTGGMSTHLPDVFLWKPIYWEGQFLCFAWTFIHVSDVGGRVAGSISPSSTDLFQEGLVLPPSRLYRQGELNQELLNLFLANSRIPEQNWGDLQAAVSALNGAERRLHEVAAYYGARTVQDATAEVLNYAEVLARLAIREIPDGRYRFWDFLEGAGVSPYPMRIRLELGIEGDEVHFDFTGTDPQAPNSLNVPTQGCPNHYYVVAGLVNYLRTVNPDIPYNSGMVRSVRATLPHGSMLNPDPDAAVGTRAATMHRINDAFLGCMAQALPDVMPTAGAGGATIVLVATRHPRTGKQLVSVIEPITGGGGARPFKDGVDGTDAFSSTVRNIPVEVIEAELPILVHSYQLRPDSGGRGRYRGGMGIEMEFELLSDSASVTARGMERRQFHPWGRAGGEPGALGAVIMNRGTAREQMIEAVDVILMAHGDRLYFGGQGGGGFGLAEQREHGAQTADSEAALVTAHSNSQPEETSVHTTPDVLAFTLGAERENYDRLWPDEVMAEFARRLHGFDGYRQQRLKQRLMLKAGTSGLTSVVDLNRLWLEVLHDMGLQQKD